MIKLVLFITFIYIIDSFNYTTLRDYHHQLITTNLIGKCKYNIVESFHDLLKQKSVNPLILFYNISTNELNNYKEISSSTLTSVNTAKLGHGVVNNMKTSNRWINDDKIGIYLPSDHPRNNERKKCIELTINITNNPINIYYDNINKIQPFYLMKFTNVYINELGIIALKCGYWQAHESCETIFKFIGRKWRNNCIVKKSKYKCELVDKPIDIKPIIKHYQNSYMYNNININMTDIFTMQALNFIKSMNISTDVKYVNEVFVITAKWDDNYHHFISDSLIRLYKYIDYLKSNPQIYIQIRGYEKFTDRESSYYNGISLRNRLIDLLGLDVNRFITGPVIGNIVYIPRPIRCCSLISHPFELRGLSKVLLLESYKLTYKENILNKYNASISDYDLSKLRSKYQYNYKSLILQHRFCLFVELCDPWREWTNSMLMKATKAISDIFTQHAVNTISSNDKTLMECLYCQIIMYANADIVIGVHGAGMTNIMFMRPGSLLVEIVGQFDGRMLPYCGYYGPLASVFGIHHYVYYFDSNGGEKLNMTDVAFKAYEFYNLIS